MHPKVAQIITTRSTVPKTEKVLLLKKQVNLMKRYLRSQKVPAGIKSLFQSLSRCLWAAQLKNLNFMQDSAIKKKKLLRMKMKTRAVVSMKTKKKYASGNAVSAMKKSHNSILFLMTIGVEVLTFLKLFMKINF